MRGNTFFQLIELGAMFGGDGYDRGKLMTGSDLLQKGQQFVLVLDLIDFIDGKNYRTAGRL